MFGRASVPDLPDADLLRLFPQDAGEDDAVPPHFADKSDVALESDSNSL